MSDQTPPRRTAAQRLQALYVRVLLRLLPHLITLLRHVSPKIRAEVAYLVRGTDLACTCRRTGRGSFERIPPARVARDVEPGSGLASADADAVAVDYVIDFRSPAYAFGCFSGGLTLKDALAQRAFSTRGPNDTGVALTYLFTAGGARIADRRRQRRRRKGDGAPEHATASVFGRTFASVRPA